MVHPPRLLRLLILLIVFLVVAPMSASAVNYFTLYPGATTGSEQTIQLGVWLDDIYGACAREGSCFQTTISVKVTPCPPGMYCASGSYQFTMALGSLKNLTLALGTKYTFEGSSSSKIGYAAFSSSCTNFCYNTQTIPSKIYETPASSGSAQLNVSVISASVDTVWVELSASGVDAQQCTNYCGYSVLETYFEVSPCALAAPLAYHLCQTNVTSGEISATQKLALKPGVAYTMWARFHRYGFSYSTSDGGCTNPACEYAEQTPNLVYTPVITATTPITWGAVKAMYRD